MRKSRKVFKKSPGIQASGAWVSQKNISDTSSFIQTVLLVPDSHRISRRMHLRVADLRMTYYRQ